MQFESAPAAYWEIREQRWYLSVVDVTEQREKALGKHRRLYRNGARLDHMGAMERTWTTKLAFYDTCTEPAILEQTKAGKPLRSVVLGEFLESLEWNETGDLCLPTRGVVRAAAERYTRVELNEERDFTGLEVTWSEDTEDIDSPETYSRPSIRSAYRDMVELYLTKEEQDAMRNEPGGVSLKSLLSMPNYEEQLSGWVGNAIDQAIGTFNLVRYEFEDRTGIGRDEATERPAAERHRTAARVERILDALYREKAKRADGSKLRTYPRAVSLIQVAAESKRPLVELLRDNPQLDPSDIPAGTPIRVRP